ncbi:MAG: glycosyltransferase [Pseudomonadota bacterium]
MNSEMANAELLADALEQLLLDPTAVHSWQRLLQPFAAADEALRRQAYGILVQHVRTDGVAGLLRATFLANVAGDASFRAQAATALLEMPQVEPDRIAANLAVTWFHVLARQPGQIEFAAAMRDAGFPAMLRRSGDYLADRMGAQFARRAIGRVGKVAVLTTQLSAATHAPTCLALTHSALLQAGGMTVELFAAQELSISHMSQLLGCGNCTKLPPPDPESWQRCLQSPLNIHMADERLSLMRRWGGLLDRLVQFDPDLILFVGLYSPLLEVLYRQRPVLALSVQSVATIGPVDVRLAADPQQTADGGASWAPHFPVAAPWHYPYRVPPEPAQPPLSRATLGLPEGALVIVSVGYRLREEIAGHWAARMVQVLLARPDVFWLLVASGDPVPAALHGLPQGQVRTLPHQSNLPGVLACCDIYVNPPRMGGGLSVAQAMAAGLPVLSFGGSDGGDKVGAAAVPDSEQYVATLQAWLADPAARTACGAAMRERFASTLDLRLAGPSLLAACDAALAHFQRRTTAASS